MVLGEKEITTAIKAALESMELALQLSEELSPANRGHVRKRIFELALLQTQNMQHLLTILIEAIEVQTADPFEPDPEEQADQEKLKEYLKEVGRLIVVSKK